MGSRSDVSPRVPPATALKFAVAASAAEQRSLRMRSQSSLALRHQEARATRATGKLERESFRLGVAERPGAPGRPLAERALSNVAPGSAQDVETTASSSLSSYRPRRSLRKGDARRHCRDRGESSSSSTDSDNATARGGRRRRPLREEGGTFGAAGTSLSSPAPADGGAAKERPASSRVPLLTTKQQLLLLRYLCISNDEASRVLVRAAARQTGPVAGAAAVAARYLAAHPPRNSLGDRHRRLQRLQSQPPRGGSSSSSSPPLAARMSGASRDSPRATLAAHAALEEEGRSAFREAASGAREDGFPSRCAEASAGAGLSSGDVCLRGGVASEPKRRSRPTTGCSSVRFRSPVATQEEPVSPSPSARVRASAESPRLRLQRGSWRAPLAALESGSAVGAACEACAWSRQSSGEAFLSLPPSRAALRRTEGAGGGEPRHTQAAKRGTCRGSCPSAQASPVSPEPQGRCFCHSMLSPDAEGPRQPPPAAPTCGCCGSGPWQSRRGVGGSLARWREAASRPCLIEAAEELPSNLHVSSSSSCSVCSCCPHARVPTAADLGSSVRHAGGQPRTRSEADAAWRPSRVSSTSVATVGALRSPSDAARFSAPTTCCHTCSPLTPHSADLPVGSPLASAPPGAAPSRAGGQGCNGCLLSSPAGHSHREFSSRSDLARAAVARDSELYTQAAATSQVPAARPAPAVGCARACRESPRPTVCEADPGDGCRPGQRQAPPAVVRRRVFLRPAVAAGQESRGLCRPGEREDLTPDDHPVRLACVQQQRTASAGLSREGVSLRGASALQQHRDLGVSPVNLSSQPVPSHRARHEPRASWQNDAGTEPPASFISSEGRGRGSAAVPPAGGRRRSEGRDWIESMRAEPESAVSARWQEDGRGPTLRTVDTSAATRTPSLRHGACSHPVPTTEEPRRRAEDLDDLHAVLERQQRELAEQLRLLDLIEMQRLQNGSLEPPKGGVRSSHPETPAGRPALQIAQAAPSPPADARVWEVDLEIVRTRVPWDDPAGPRGSSQVEAGGRPDRTRGLPPHADDRQTRGGGLPPATRAETAEGGLSAAEQHEQRLRELEDVVWMLTAAERNRTGAPLHA